MYTIYVQFTCLSGKREAYVKKMQEEGILDLIRSEDGCRQYDFYFSEANENELLLIEAWESKRHQEIHMTQPHMACLREFRDDYIESATLGEFELK